MASPTCHGQDEYRDSEQVEALSSTGNIVISTPQIKVIDNDSSTRSSRATSERSSSLDPCIRPFRPYTGNPRDPIDSHVDTFLNSLTFESICIQAIQLAAIIPTSAPPTLFVSFDSTPMHHWYQALLIEFIETFMRHLRILKTFPVCCHQIDSPATDALYVCEDIDAFNNEATAHVNAILTSFNTSFATRYRGSTESLLIDTSQPNASVASLALREATSLASSPPKKDWRVGEPLHAEYKRRLRMFEAGVTRLMAEREESRWMLGLSRKLERGIAAFEEYFIAYLREEILQVRSNACSYMDNDLVMSQNMEDVFT